MVFAQKKYSNNSLRDRKQSNLQSESQLNLIQSKIFQQRCETEFICPTERKNTSIHLRTDKTGQLTSRSFSRQLMDIFRSQERTRSPVENDTSRVKTSFPQTRNIIHSQMQRRTLQGKKSVCSTVLDSPEKEKIQELKFKEIDNPFNSSVASSTLNSPARTIQQVYKSPVSNNEFEYNQQPKELLSLRLQKQKSVGHQQTYFNAYFIGGQSSAIHQKYQFKQLCKQIFCTSDQGEKMKSILQIQKGKKSMAKSGSITNLGKQIETARKENTFLRQSEPSQRMVSLMRKVEQLRVTSTKVSNKIELKNNQQRITITDQTYINRERRLFSNERLRTLETQTSNSESFSLNNIDPKKEDLPKSLYPVSPLVRQQSLPIIHLLNPQSFNMISQNKQLK